MDIIEGYTEALSKDFHKGACSTKPKAFSQSTNGKQMDGRKMRPHHLVLVECRIIHLAFNFYSCQLSSRALNLAARKR
uniref:HTH_48 domain-containing protein n=1 Tax=Ascaris lumbricoides TaxID=6252 RepID=A0A0M3I8N2_ASCLU